jgi:membrane-bound lytic murein transglycosylase F
LKTHGNAKRILSVIALGMILLSIIYLISGSILESQGPPPKSQLQRIRERGYLLAATDKNTLNYFIYRGEAMGYQLELLQLFARYLGVPLRIIASDRIPQLQYFLNYRVADILALNIPITPSGKKLATLSKGFGDTRLVIVQQRAGARTSLEEFKGDTIIVKADPFMTPLYNRIKSEGDDGIIIREISDTSQVDLVRMVSEGKIKYTVCEENLAMILKRTWLNLDAGLVVAKHFSYAWGTHPGSDSLATLLNTWIDSVRKDRVLKKIYINYYDNQKTTGFLTGKYSSISTARISPYDDELRNLSRIIWWDWRLLASLMYEESNFMQGQVSRRSATGLMQMVPETAEKFGLDSTSGPARQIAAGIQYLKWIDKQLPPEISDPMERVSFILASYNVGIGRVLSLRKKAGEFGKDPNKWQGHVEYYLLKRSKKDPYAKADSLSFFPVNYATEGYVDGIISRYYHYRNLIP